MKYAIFNNQFVVTTNDDGTIPLNAIVVCDLPKGGKAQDALAEMIERANAYQPARKPKFVTVSVSKLTGDRSYCTDIWEMLEDNAGHWLLKAVNSRYPEWKKKLVVIEKSNFDIFPADHFKAAS